MSSQFVEVGRQGGFEGGHHALLWQMPEHETALQACSVVTFGGRSDAEAIKRKMVNRSKILHTALELKYADHTCSNPEVIIYD